MEEEPKSQVTRKTRDRKGVGKGRVLEEAIIYKVNTGKERGDSTPLRGERRKRAQQRGGKLEEG